MAESGSISRSIAKTVLIVGLALVITTVGAYAIQRWVRGNFHEVLPGELYRAAQPSSAQFHAWTEAHDIATVLNLRDDRGFHPEAAEAHAAGVHYVHLPFSDLVPPERWPFLALLDSLESLPRPLLIHCRAGADRTGVASVLALMALGGRSFVEARSQLGSRYLHFGDDPDAVESVVLLYEDHCDRFERDPGGWTEFRCWVRDHYSQAYFLVDIAAPDTVRTAPRTLTTVDLLIHNRTGRAIPGDDPAHDIKVVAYAGSATDLVPDREYPPRLPLWQAVAPYDSLRVAMEFWSPDEAGIYEIRYDLLEEHVTWFCAEGSPERVRVLAVEEP